MSHGTEHHLEESHHAAHAAHDEFTKRVAMTMAIIAAALAFVTLRSHQYHNLTLQQQIQADMKSTAAANRWAQYQAKTIRKNEYEAFIAMLPVLAQPDKAERAKQVSDDFANKVKRYDTPAEEEKDKNDPKELAGIRDLAERWDKEAERLFAKSEESHHHAERFDLGELGLSFGLVLCSVSVLTKRSLLWIAGIGVAALGFLVALSAYVPFLMPH
jgi:hypothetical protein